MSKLKIFLKGLRCGFKDFGLAISSIINFILLILVYFAGVGLTSVIAKISGKHFLNIKKPKNVNSYWSDLNLSKESEESYYRQF